MSITSTRWTMHNEIKYPKMSNYTFWVDAKDPFIDYVETILTILTYKRCIY